jgi:hypothetical protein
MDEKAYIIPNIIFFLLIIVFISFSFGAGYYYGNRSAIREVGQPNDEFRKQLEDKQRRIDELEIRLSSIRNMVSDVSGSICGTVDRISGQIDFALNQSSDIGTTVRLIREAVKELEASELYYRELANRLSGSEYHSGSE